MSSSVMGTVVGSREGSSAPPVCPLLQDGHVCTAFAAEDASKKGKGQGKGMVGGFHNYDPPSAAEDNTRFVEMDEALRKAVHEYERDNNGWDGIIDDISIHCHRCAYIHLYFFLHFSYTHTLSHTLTLTYTRKHMY